MSYVKRHKIRCSKGGQKNFNCYKKRKKVIKNWGLKVDLPNRTRVWPNLAQKIRLCEIVIKEMRGLSTFC